MPAGSRDSTRSLSPIPLISTESAVSGWSTFTLRGEALDLDRVRVAADLHPVMAVGGVEDDVLGLAVRRPEVDVHLAHAGGAQVVHGDRVATSEGDEVDAFDAVRCPS